MNTLSQSNALQASNIKEALNRTLRLTDVVDMKFVINRQKESE